MTETKQSRINNFDFLRVLAASLVLISHQYALTGQLEPTLFGVHTLGKIGVVIFFSISGFLVTQSWHNDPHALRFVAKRLLRIWPGVAVVTLLWACALGPIVSTYDWKTYFTAPEFVDYLRNLKLWTTRYLLPGVFETNIYPKAVNGSLWTIPIELRWYLITLLLGIVSLLNRRRLALACAAAFVAWYFSTADTAPNYQYEFGVYFLSGICLALFGEIWQTRSAMVIGTGVAASAVAYFFGKPDMGLFCLVPVLVVWIGNSSTPLIRRFGRFGDLSFGIYIYAFPVQQTVLWMGGRNLPFLYGLLLSAIVTIILAYFSWHLVERPALDLKRHLPGMDASGIVSRWRLKRSQSQHARQSRNNP